MSSALFWFLLGLVFLGVELAMPHLVLLFFGLGAWSAALTSLLGGGYVWQLCVFITASFLALFLLRRYVKAIFGGRSHEIGDGGEPDPEHPLVGRYGIAAKGFCPGEVGEVQVDGSFWRAVADVKVAAGPIRVLGVLPDDALILRVAPVGEKHCQRRENNGSSAWNL